MQPSVWQTNWRVAVAAAEPAFKLLIVADDVTGAADTAAPFAAAGWPACVHLAGALNAEYAVAAVSTESRALPPDAAANTVQTALKRLPTFPKLVYKKIDSTLRGNAGAELAAVVEVLGAARVLVAPAFPGQGRTTVDGRQCIGGEPLEAIDFGPERLRSDVAGVLLTRPDVTHVHIPLPVVRGGFEALCTALTAHTGYLLADAETDADLDRIADAGLACGVACCCGSAGLAHALARRLNTADAAPAGPPACGPVLIVAGSRNPVTLRQIEALVDAGVERTELDAASTSSGAHAVMVPPRGPVHAEPVAVAQKLGAAARDMLARGQFGAVVLTGGDTASAVLQALGARCIAVQGELEPGMAWGTVTGGEAPGITVVTKAGGFGDTRTLCRAVAAIDRLPPGR